MPRGTRNSGRNAFDKGSDMIATASAVLLTFFAAPLAFHTTISAAEAYTYDNYGPTLAGLVWLPWAALSAAITFGGCRMALALTLRLFSARLSGMIFGRRFD
ncbi:hypothetical protein ACR9YC_02115 [Parasphingorhabdus sp. DH2-15]|uniref:hypothetical protein n=1 Tax=Parasphingorhabdus sp. DH2-15 TaxID=3444112 RepID=UPI003F68970F